MLGNFGDVRFCEIRNSHFAKECRKARVSILLAFGRSSASWPHSQIARPYLLLFLYNALLHFITWLTVDSRENYICSVYTRSTFSRIFNSPISQIFYPNYLSMTFAQFKNQAYFKLNNLNKIMLKICILLKFLMLIV